MDDGTVINQERIEKPALEEKMPVALDAPLRPGHLSQKDSQDLLCSADQTIQDRIERTMVSYPIPPSPRPEPAQLMVATQQLLIANTLRTYGGHVDLLMLGDSLTQSWQWDPSWEKKINAGRKILNFGLGGDGIEHLLWRLEQGLVDQLQVSQVMLLIGINSLKPTRTADQIVHGIEQCLERVRQGLPAAAILLYGIFPVRCQHPSTNHNPLIQEINLKLKTKVAHHGVDFRDIGDRFRTDSGHVPISLMPDGTHLSGTAYDIWSKDLLNWLSGVTACLTNAKNKT